MLKTLRKIGSIGFPNFYIEVKIVDTAGEELREPEKIGELCLKGPVCTPGPEVVVHRLPRAETLGQVAPWRTGA